MLYLFHYFTDRVYNSWRSLLVIPGH